ELMNKRQARVDVRVGSPIPVNKLSAIPSDEERIAYLRWRTYLLAERKTYKPRTKLPLPAREGGSAGMSPIAPPVPAGVLAAEVGRLAPERLLAKSGQLAAYLAPADEIPVVLTEIGRLRETSFRAAGEGTGNASDVDQFDAHYLHLFVW